MYANLYLRNSSKNGILSVAFTFQGPQNNLVRVVLVLGIYHDVYYDFYISLRQIDQLYAIT